MPQHVAAPTIPPMIHCSTVFTQELPQFPSPTVLTLPPCHPLPPGEIIPSPVACSFPHWCWFTQPVVAAVQSIFNILFNGSVGVCQTCEADVLKSDTTNSSGGDLMLAVGGRTPRGHRAQMLLIGNLAIVRIFPGTLISKVYSR